jgi:hypothetical protein
VECDKRKADEAKRNEEDMLVLWYGVKEDEQD